MKPPNLTNVKACTTCKELKTLNEYCVDNSRIDGRRSMCRECDHRKNKRKLWKRRQTINLNDLSDMLKKHGNFTDDVPKLFTHSQLLTIFKDCLYDLETHTANA
jgi:hypothetical protein